MSGLIEKKDDIKKLVLHQLGNFWVETDEEVINDVLPDTLIIIEESFKGVNSSRFYDAGEVLFSPLFSIHWMLFLYRLSNQIYKKYGGIKEADQVYYLNKIMHGNDWFYTVELPKHFLCEHPLGSVLGHAKYGDYFFVYQGTTVGGNRKDNDLSYPIIGENVMLYANATVIGDTHIGNNVVVSANTFIINEFIPDNCIVFGKTPNLIIKEKTEEEIKKYTNHIWRWVKG